MIADRLSPSGRARWSRRSILGGLAGLGVGAAVTGLGSAAGGPFRFAVAPRQLPRVGYLSLYGPDDPGGSLRPYLEWFHEGLEENGYADGQNIVVEHRFAGGSAEQLRAFAEELVSIPADVIVAADTEALNVVWQVTSTLPVVMVISFDPVSFGQIESLSRPGKNITGLTLLGISLVPKHVELLKTAVPELTRLAVLQSANPTARISPKRLADATEAAEAMGIELDLLTVNEADEIEAALGSAAGRRADALLILPDLFLTKHARAIAEHTMALGLPAIADSLAWVEAGLFMAYAVSRPSMFHRAAFYVAKILRGTNAAEIPAERPSRFELILNLKTAETLGRTFPQRLLQVATSVVR